MIKMRMLLLLLKMRILDYAIDETRIMFDEERDLMRNNLERDLKL